MFDTELSYRGIVEAVKERDPARFLSTIEFFPEEGKYHYDGHRACGVRWSPQETKNHKGVCSKCGRNVTVGVTARIEELADRPVGYKPTNAIPFKNLVPFDEIIAESFGVESKTKRVYEAYMQIVTQFGGELPLLLDGDLSQVQDAKIAEGIRRVREGQLHIEPGYDGEYGKIKIFEEGEKAESTKLQSSLF